MVAASMAPDHRRPPRLPAGVPGLAPPSRPPAPAQCGLIRHESSSSPPCNASPPAPTPAPASFTGDVRGGTTGPWEGTSEPWAGTHASHFLPPRAGAAPAVLCRPNGKRTARQGRTSCAVQAPQEPPARRGRTSCAVQAPQEPPHARAAPAVQCRPHRNPRTPGPHQQCCAGPTGTPARQGRTSCAMQAPQEPPHARAAPIVLCRPHRNPRAPGPHQLCWAGPTATPARQGRTSCAVQAPQEPPHAGGRTSCAVQAPQETGSAPPRPRPCGSGARRQIAPSPVVGERRPEARGNGAPQVPEQVVPPAGPPASVSHRSGHPPPRSGGRARG